MRRGIGVALLVLGLLTVASGQFCLPTTVPTCWPNNRAWSAFQDTLSQDAMVYYPDKIPDRFLTQAVTMNLLKSNVPGVIVVPSNEDDLRKTVVFATQNRLRIAMRCSGHDFAGRSTGRGVVVIKTENLNKVTYDDRTKTVSFEAGASHGAIYEALVPYKRVYVGGQSKTVCAAGCLAGGCHGLLSRQFGLGIDNIIEIRIALFNGTVVTANRNTNSALFHAYLGAGQNSFGVALSFRARTFDAPLALLKMDVTLHLMNPDHPDKYYQNVLYDYLLSVAFWDTLPRELSANIYVNGPAGVVGIQFFYLGSDLVGAFNSLEPLLGSPYIIDFTPIRNYSSLYDLALDNYPAVTEIWQRKFISNVFLPYDQGRLDDLIREFFDVDPLPTIYMWMVFGGKVWEGTNGAIAKGMRNAMYEALIGSQWVDPGEDEAQMSFVQNYLPTLFAATDASYNNEFTTYGNLYGEIPDWKNRFYNDYISLMATKKRYDPCNYFVSKYGVGSDQPGASC